ncbi:MAG: carboxypeptidase regulatory-like domain-containing protein [Patescibacteria group bacterium]
MKLLIFKLLITNEMLHLKFRHLIRNSKFKIQNSAPAFTLIEVILDAFVITIIFGAVIGSFLVMLNATNSGKIRTMASALANEQMEYLRNIPYDSLSTQDGLIIPQGSIPDTQTVTRGGVSFKLDTMIIFVDDPFDGCVIPVDANPSLWQCTDGSTSATFDVVPVDYKRINVEALKVGTPTVLIKLSSNAAAKAAETPSNTGMMLVKVIDAQGAPVASATVTVDNTATNTSMTGLTNAQGYVFVANLTPDNQNGYHIVATKTGYSTDLTTSRTSQNPNQIQPDVDINIQQVTIQTLAIDWLSTMAVTVTNETGQILNGISITATSAKITATNPDTPKHVETRVSDTNGVATWPNFEWDSYILAPQSGYYVVSTSPYQLVALNPNTTLSVALVLTTNPNWPRITNVSPASGTTGAIVEVIIEGYNFTGNTTVLLRKVGSADILPTIINVDPNQKAVTATFDLTGAAIDEWDFILDSNGQIITQIGGFIVSS